MPLTSRKSRPLPRHVPMLRDARLFIVATEDTCAPKQYFSFFPHPRVHVEVLETHDGLSSPAHVINRLIRYADLYQIGEDDQLWALLDTDHWISGNHKPNLIASLNEARQRGYHVAMSNPCFDLWLLLHQRAVMTGESLVNGNAVSEAIRQTLGEFNKTRLKPHNYLPEQVGHAVQRARALELEGVDAEAGFWPESTGSRVYLLIEQLRAAGLGFAGVPLNA
jgi:hypothetical protein